MGDSYDAPNQQAVRPDGSHPSEEGKGGSTRKTKDEAPKPKPKPAAKPAAKSEGGKD